MVSFVAVAPAEDPQIALLVMLDTPGGTTPVNLRSGGYMAAPVAGKMLADILPYIGVEPQYTGEELFGSDVVIPQFAGLTLDEAKTLMNKKGLSFKTVGSGEKVTGQIPAAAGAKVTSSAEIILYMGENAPAGKVKVPDVTRMSPENANKVLTNAGLYLRPTGAITSAASTVTASSQSIAAGTEVQRGTGRGH